MSFLLQILKSFLEHSRGFGEEAQYKSTFYITLHLILNRHFLFNHSKFRFQNCAEKNPRGTGIYENVNHEKHVKNKEVLISYRACLCGCQLFTDSFSGPDKAVGTFGVCLCIRTTTF